MADTAVFDILCVGLDANQIEFLTPLLAPLRPKYLSTAADVEDFLENYQLGAGSPVIVSTFTQGMSHLEVGQALGSYFQGLHLIFITFDRAAFELSKLKKNSFTDVNLLPLDRQALIDTLDYFKAKSAGGIFKKYKAVKLIDIDANSVLPFEVSAFLPANNKYVTLTSSGQLSQKKIDRLKQSHTNSVFIDTAQIEKFYEFSAESLINSGKSSNDGVSATEKSERQQSAVRELFRSIMDSSESGNFEQGRDLAEQSKKVVEHYMVKKVGVNLSDKLKELMGEGRDAYSHAQIVSTMGCLLSLATEIGKPEDIAIAGLFHDIGIQGAKVDVSIFDFDSLTLDEQKQYTQHPKASVNLLRDKRITVSAEIADMIEKHHERIDSKGFPMQLAPHKIPAEAHLLAYVDAFEYLTRAKPGVATLTPLQAHKIISAKLGLAPEVLGKIAKFLESLA